MADRLLLVADIGNTRIKLALLNKSARLQGDLAECVRTWTIPQGETVDWALIRREIDSRGAALHQALVAGSQKERIEQWEREWPENLGELRVIRAATELPIALEVDYPEKVGVDRVLNAVAVNCLRKTGNSAVIVDAGTAITIDAVSSAGAFLGGAILPGYELEAHALHRYTSLLPLIPMEKIIGQTPDVIGKNTQAALRSGLIWGQVGAVNEIVQRMSSFLSPEGEPTMLFLSGGAAPLLEPYLAQKFQNDPLLTLRGLGCLADDC